MALGDLVARIILRLQDEASQGLATARSRVRGLRQDVEGITPLDNVVKTTFDNIKAYIISAFAVASVIQFANKLIDTIRSIQDLGLRLSGLTKSAMDYAASQVYLTNLADRYHKSVSAMTSSYASFLALENSGIITRQQSILLLQGFANAAAKTGASQDQMGQSTYGLAQALGTGIVAIEEFKQITEPMPGLANEIAKAFGMTVGELRVLIGTGTVASEEFGRKFVVALQAYEGAAERAGGTVSASYADIANEYNKMARALEKPVAGGLLNLVDVGKSAFGWIKDNSSGIITVLELIAVTLTGKVLSALNGVAAGYVARYQAETRARASSIALAEADVALAAQESALAADALRLTAANIELAQSNLALVQSDMRAEAATLAVTNATIARSRAEVAALSSTVQTTSVQYLLRNATVQLTEAESARSASLARLAALGQQQAAVSAEITAASAAQAKAGLALTASQLAQEKSTLALTNATNASSVAMTRAAAAGKAAFSFIGGWVGAAVIAIYGLYTALEKITGSEEKAEARAKAMADAVALMHAEVKKLSEQEVDIDFTKTTHDIEAIQTKIKGIEKFEWNKIFNVGDLEAQRANLTQTLDVLKQRKEALIAQKNEQIINFDASKLSADELSAALEETKAKIAEITNRVEPLKQQVANGFLNSEAINGDLLLLNAYEAKLSALQAVTGEHVKSQQQLKKAFEAAQDAAKAMTANIDAEAKMQTAAIESELAARLADIDAANLSEAQKDTQRLSAKLEAHQLELQLQEDTAAAKLAIIDREYKAEYAKAATDATHTADLETQKRQAKLAVYSGLAEYYQSEVDRLGSVYADEMQKAAQVKLQLQTLNQSHEQALFNIKLMGMNEREKIDAEESRFADIMRQVAKERAKGEQGDQEKINALLGEARDLHGQITSTAGNGSDALSRAKMREIELYKEEKATLEDNAQQHEDNARRAEKAQDDVASKLEETRAAIDGITEQLGQTYVLKIGIDQDSLSSAWEAINALTADATKTIYVTEVKSAAAQATGGPAGQPTGEPWRFSIGGYTPMSGKLPGYGGGDQIRALLEPGEFIVRKEAVQALGLPFMYSINAGEVPTLGNNDIITALQNPGFVGSGALQKLVQNLNMPLSALRNIQGLGGSSINDLLANPGIGGSGALAKLGLPLADWLMLRDLSAGDVIRRSTGGPVGKQPDWQLVSNNLLTIAKSTSNMYSMGADNAQGVASGSAARGNQIIWKSLMAQVNDLMARAGTPDFTDEAVSIVQSAANSGTADNYQAVQQRITDAIAQRVAADQAATTAAATAQQRKADNDAIFAAAQAKSDAYNAAVRAGANKPIPAAIPAGNLLSQLTSSTPLADISAKIKDKAATFTLPMPELPTAQVTPATAPVSPGQTMRVQFVSPVQSTSTGSFNPADATAMLQVLKEAGARTV